MVTFVKRKLGDDVLSVELTKKEIWSCFEEATLEYGRHIHELKIKSDLINVLGLPTGTTDFTNRYPHQTLEYLLRMADPYAAAAYVGGMYDAELGYFDIENGRQDYNIYTELKYFNGPNSGSVIYDTLPTGSKGPLRIVEVFHLEPLAAQRMLLNASNITNFLATNFNYESYVNSTVFYVLPIFEDVLRRGMLEAAFRVRRSNYSYEIIGSNLRIYPIPTNAYLPIQPKLFVKVSIRPDPLNPSALPDGDDSIYGVSGPHNVPFNIIPFDSITEPGRQWIRQYCLALCKELLGLIRSKFQTIPIPNADLTLNGEALISQGREDRDRLTDQIREFLDTLTNEKLTEQQANIAENVAKQLKYIPMPTGKSILVG
jgi:hypothetical protein